MKGVRYVPTRDHCSTNYCYADIKHIFLYLHFFLTAGATQVRWNRLSRYLLATAHSGDVKLWDQRKGVIPVQYITAHLSNVIFISILISLNLHFAVSA